MQQYGLAKVVFTSEGAEGNYHHHVIVEMMNCLSIL